MVLEELATTLGHAYILAARKGGVEYYCEALKGFTFLDRKCIGILCGFGLNIGN